jgi:hypothetical protein
MGNLLGREIGCTAIIVGYRVLRPAKCKEADEVGRRAAFARHARDPALERTGREVAVACSPLGFVWPGSGAPLTTSRSTDKELHMSKKQLRVVVCTGGIGSIAIHGIRRRPDMESDVSYQRPLSQDRVVDRL